MRLILKDEDFRKKIKDSKKEVDGFKGVGQQAFGKVGVALKGLAAAAGAVKVAVEGFKVVVGSSQALTDAWGRSLEAMKISFDNFVYSLASADFSSFNDGLSTMIQRAKDAYDAMDQLANTKLSADFVTTLDQSKYREAMSRARNKNLSKEEREAALQEARGYLGTIQEAGAKLSSDSEKALKAKFSAKLGIGEEHITAQMVEEAFRVDARFSSDEERKAIKREYKAYLAAVEEAKERAKQDTDDFRRQQKFAYKGTAQHKQNILQAKEFRAAREAEYIAATHQQYAGSAAKYLALERLSDEDLAADMQLYLQSVSARNAAAEMSTSINEVALSLTNEQKPSAKKLQDAPASAISYKPAVGLSFAAQAPVSFEAPKLSAEKEYEIWSTTRLEGWADATMYNAAVENMKKVEEGANSLGDSFNALGGAIGGSAGSLLSFAGSTLEAIGAVIPFISLLQAEAIQHNVNATAAMKEAAAKTMAAYSGIPFAGVALGIAAVSAIVGTLQALPALAEGGIATGPTMALIGEAGKEAVIPLDKLNDFINVAPREVHVTGEVRASGKDLVITIDNYNKVRRIK